MQYVYLNGKENDKPELVLIRGVQGSGKTTLAQKISQLGYKHHENDQFFTDENGEYQFDFSKHQTAKEETLRKTQLELEKGNNVVVSNTFNTLKELNVYIDMAKKIGVHVNVINTKLNYKNIHKIPSEVIEKAKLTYEDRELDQKITSPNVVLIKDPNEMTLVMYQSEIKDGIKVPKLMVKDSIERLKLSYAYINNLFENSEDKTQNQEEINENRDVVKKVLSMLSVGRMDEAIESIEEGSIYAKNVLMPQEFVDILKEDQELKEKINKVLVSYLVNSNKAEIEDRDLSLEIYKKKYQLGINKPEGEVLTTKNKPKERTRLGL